MWERGYHFGLWIHMKLCSMCCGQIMIKTNSIDNRYVALIFWAHFIVCCYFVALKMHSGNAFQVLRRNCQIEPAVQCQPIFVLWIINPSLISSELFNLIQNTFCQVLDSGQITPIKHSPRVKFQWLLMSFCWLPAIRCSEERGSPLQPSQLV